MADLQTVLERLAQVERRAKRLKVALEIVAVVVITGLAGIFLTLGRPASSLKAAQFVLVRDGAARAMLQLVDGEPSLSMFDAAGRETVTLGLSSSGTPVFRLKTGMREDSITMGVQTPSGGGGAAILFTDAMGVIRARLGVVAGKAALTVFDENGIPTHQAGP